MTLCEDCPKRNSCTELCPEAERYVRQDHVSQKELLVGDVNIINHLDMSDLIPMRELNAIDWVSFTRSLKLTKRQKKYLYLRLWKHWSYSKIARKFNTSRQNVCQIIKRIYTKLEE